jgi:hypothetical protein
VCAKKYFSHAKCALYKNFAHTQHVLKIHIVAQATHECVSSSTYCTSYPWIVLLQTLLPGRDCNAASVLLLDVSVLQQPVLALDVSFIYVANCEAEFLDVIVAKVLSVFILAIRSHFY